MERVTHFVLTPDLTVPSVNNKEKDKQLWLQETRISHDQIIDDKTAAVCVLEIFVSCIVKTENYQFDFLEILEF